MKRLLLVLTMMLSLFATVEAQSDYKFGKDYLYASPNFIQPSDQFSSVVGGLGGGVGYLLGMDLTDGDDDKARWIGTGVGTGCVIIIELTDIGKPGKGFSTSNVVFGAAGAALGSYLSKVLFSNNWHENKRREVEELEKKRLESMTDEERLLDKL